MIFSCGICGAPCKEDGVVLNKTPPNFNPDNHPHTWCNSCAQEQEEIYRVVTREMALDAGEPNLEGSEF